MFMRLLSMFFILLLLVCAGCKKVEEPYPSANAHILVGETSSLSNYVDYHNQLISWNLDSFDLTQDGENDLTFGVSADIGNFYSRYNYFMEVADDRIQFHNKGRLENDTVFFSDEFNQSWYYGLASTYSSSVPVYVNDSTYEWESSSYGSGDWVDEAPKYAVYRFYDGQYWNLGWIKVKISGTGFVVFEYGYKVID
jgi:hypothetical protein